MKAFRDENFNDAIADFTYCLARLQLVEPVLNDEIITTSYNLGSAYLSNANYPLAYHYLRLAYANCVAMNGMEHTKSEKYKAKLKTALNELVPYDPLQWSSKEFTLPDSPFYIECGQDGICRLDLEKSPKQILGLFTQGV